LSHAAQELRLASPDFSELKLNDSQNASFQIGIEDIFQSLNEGVVKNGLTT